MGLRKRLQKIEKRLTGMFEGITLLRLIKDIKGKLKREALMSMFCYQCQETAGNKGCKARGVCGKADNTANLMDLLFYIIQGIGLLAEKALKEQVYDKGDALFVQQALFATITNTNFDDSRIISLIEEAILRRDKLKYKFLEAYKKNKGKEYEGAFEDRETWKGPREDILKKKSEEVGFIKVEDEDERSLKSLIIFGVKGIAAYADHAAVLGFSDDEVNKFVFKAVAATASELSNEELLSVVMDTGKYAVDTMALLDKANTATYGNPGLTEVGLGVGKNPGILISGHDLRDMEELLKQTEGTGVDVYTHGEMLPAQYYPAFKKYKHLAGNYGSSWWHQNKDFETFNGVILMTTNCIIPVRDSYKDRIFTTGMAGYPGVKHIKAEKPGAAKDFSGMIDLAKKCAPPKEIETGTITGGFAHNQIMALADKVVDAVKTGAIKRFVVMAGCDGRMKSRQYFTDVAEALPKDTVILTAGCAKYRYNKLKLGDIDGIPRVLDAGQCNDSYSLAVTALKLQEIFKAKDINALPISFDIAWYEQKAVAVLLALLHLGVKGIRLGPTLPAFLSPNIAGIIVEKFGLKPTGDASDDVTSIMAGK